MKNISKQRLLFYFLGMVIMAFGISLSLISGIDIGNSNIIFFTALVLFQPMLLRNKFKIKELF